MYMDRDNLPNFNSFEYYVVKVTVNNNGPEYAIDSSGVGEWVIQRYGRSMNQRGRKLNDLGHGPDAVINDNIHTKAVCGPGIGRNQEYLDHFTVLMISTLFTEDGGYNSITWSIPYRSQRPE